MKTSHIAYFYENTVLIEEKHYSKNELSYSTEVDITDRDSIKITEKTSYLSESELTHYRKTITVNGNRTYVESTFSGNQNYSSEIHEYSYDSFGNIIEYIHSSSSTLGSNSSWNLTYEYRDFDEKKNWITKLIYGNGKLYTLAEREIEYY